MASNHIYISKNVALIVAVFVIAAFIALGIGLYVLLTRQTLTNPLETYKPLTDIVPGKKGAGKIAQVAGGSTSSSNKLTIIFFYDGYEKQDEALTAVEVMKEALNIVEPFKSMKDMIDTKVFTTDGIKCRVEADSKLLVCKKELIESFRKLGTNHFKVVLISPEEFSSNAVYARGANSWIAISTNPKGAGAAPAKQILGFTFTRLLGRSLGLFYEFKDIEHVPGVIAPPDLSIPFKPVSSGSPNCAPDLTTARAWWGSYEKVYPSQVSYFQGCGSSKDAYYPERDTLMSETPNREGYGIVSEDYLRGVLSCFYSQKSSIVLPAEKTASESARMSTLCSDFKAKYPSFWQE